MREMSDGHLSLLVDGREPWALVVDFEREDAMLVRGGEGGAESRTVVAGRGRLQCDAMEGR
jgi:hypothetical protein